MASLDSSDNVMRFLSLVRETFFLQHSSLPRQQQESLWRERSSGWRTELERPFAADAVNPGIDAMNGLDESSIQPSKSQDASSMSRSRTEYPPFHGSQDLDNLPSPHFRKKRAYSFSTDLKPPRPTGEGLLDPSNDQHFYSSVHEEAQSGPQKAQKTTFGKRPLPRVLESDLHEPVSYLKASNIGDDGARPISSARRASRNLSSSYTERRSDAMFPPVKGLGVPIPQPPNRKSWKKQEPANLDMSRQNSLGGSLYSVLDNMTIESPYLEAPLKTLGNSVGAVDIPKSLPPSPDTQPTFSYEKVKIQENPRLATSSVSTLTNQIAPPSSNNSSQLKVEGSRLPVSPLESPSISKERKVGPEAIEAQQAERPLRPKRTGDSRIASAVQSHGTSPTDVRRLGDKVAIPKATSVRPPRQKMKCPQCNERPEGFKGDHELRRHIERNHSEVRKVWICINGSDDPDFLSNCKNCREQKPYGAYYNAAAHLRRVHFNPRPKGSRARGGKSNRAGNGGGNFPPMSVLKNFMKEIEETVVKDDLSADSDEEFEEQLDEHAFTFPNYEAGSRLMNHGYQFSPIKAETTFGSFNATQPFEHDADILPQHFANDAVDPIAVGNDNNFEEMFSIEMPLPDSTEGRGYFEERVFG